MLPHFNKAVIAGVGLLGGSLGMAMRRRHLAERIVGLGRSRKRLERAAQLGALDDFTTDAAEALDGADAFITCLPPRAIRKKWSELAPMLAPGAFVTDVGSVKAALVSEAERALDPGVLFIGSHPMAGSEKSGVESARGDLFEGASCFVTPSPRTAPAALALATGFWQAVGSRVVVMDPTRHDALLAQISHLPHLVAAALVQALYAGGDATLLYQALIGNGFRDSTRIAAGPADVWEQIFTENAGPLSQTLGELIGILTEWKAALDGKDGGPRIAQWLESAREQRLELGGSPTNAPEA